MSRIIPPLLFLLGRSTEHDLRRQIQYLKIENQILRARLPKRIVTTPAERRRLLKFGKPLGSAIRQLITIVTPGTFLRWARAESGKEPAKRPGRPCINQDIRELVVKIARETGFGYTRIVGELRRLGIRNVCRVTVKNILHENGFDPAPIRGESTWDEFIRRHQKTLWACDFFSVRTWTMNGAVDLYALVFMHVDSWRVFLSRVTAQPDRFWTAQQARNFLLELDGETEGVILIRDRDDKFASSFDYILRSEGLRVNRLPVQSPNLNAYVERWIWSVKHEATNHFVFLGARHLQYVIDEYVQHYNNHRAHSSCQHLPPARQEKPEAVDSLTVNDVVRHERLGGLLVRYDRRAA
jgi:putative transposase